MKRVFLAAPVLGLLVATAALPAQQPDPKLTLGVHFAAPFGPIGSRMDEQLGGGLELGWGVRRQFELALGLDGLDDPGARACVSGACDTRYLAALGTLAARVILLPEADLQPYVGAGGYASWWGGGSHSSNGSGAASGAGPAGALAQAGARWSSASTASWFLRADVTMYFDLADVNDRVARLGIGWRL